MKRDVILDSIRRLIQSELPEAEESYLFGSWAKGSAVPTSDIDIAVAGQCLLDEKKIKFVIIDSLSTLLLYNDAKEVEKFLHGLFNKTRKSNASIIITSPKEKSKEDLFAEITQFCDKEIEL